jgi:hypothetical protein
MCFPRLLLHSAEGDHDRDAYGDQRVQEQRLHQGVLRGLRLLERDHAAARSAAGSGVIVSRGVKGRAWIVVAV